MFNVQQTIKDLEATIDHLRQADWVQGRNFTSSGACCTWGAMIYVTSGSQIDPIEQSIDRMADMGRAFKQVMDADVVTYNDTEGRTKTQVIEAVQKTLNALRADSSIFTGRKEKADAQVS